MVRADLVVLVVEDLHDTGHPVGSALGEDELEVGVTLEHPGEDQHPQRAVGEEAGFDEEHPPRRGEGSVVGARVRGVVVDRHVELGTGRPDRFVRRVDERREAAVGWDPGEENAAEQVCLLRPADLRHRRVDVVEQDLRHPRAPTWGVGTEVGEPAVVRLQALPTQLVLAGLRWARGEVARREERRDRVRVQQFRGQPVAARLLEPTL